MENAGASSLQKEIRRGMVTRVDRDYNALQRPLGVNKKLKIQVHTVNANTNKGGQIQGKIIGIRIHFSMAHKEKQNIKTINGRGIQKINLPQ